MLPARDANREENRRISPSEAADHVDIGQCLQRYGQALDDRAFDLFDSVFTPDARIHYDIDGRAWDEGPDTLKANSRKLFERFYWTQHIFSAPIVELAGDSARATCRLIATHVQVDLAGERSAWVVYGIYRDALVRTPAGWRIRERTLHGLYSEGELLPRKSVQKFASPPEMARRDRSGSS